jgi:ABC-type bacteriocin/lantibiotic exporter with double-glycine peptidase domain
MLNFPELRQTFNYDCGACAGCSILAYYGVDLREEHFMALAGTTRAGTHVAGLVRAFEHFGLVCRHGRLTLPQVRAALDRREPVLLTLQAYRASARPYRELWGDGHFVVAIGHEPNRILFEDPSSYKRTWLADPELLERWHDLDTRNKRLLQWGCIVHGRPAFRRGATVHMD